MYFDDLYIKHSKSRVVQVENYYPFGLSIAELSTTRGNIVEQNYLYQGKELQEDFGLEVYDFEARMYSPSLARTWQQDPLSEKYYSLSSYSWVANNPLIFTDPTGREIDWSQLSGKRKRILKRALRKHKSSGTYKNLYKQLKKSDNTYVIKAEYNENTTAGASFAGNFSTTIEGPDGDKVSIQNPNTRGDFAVEEVVHAAQYDDLNQGEGEAIGLPGTANTEFEAKAVVGQIQSESKKQLWTSNSDKIANNYGVNAYKKRKVKNTRPTLLIRLINDR